MQAIALIVMLVIGFFIGLGFESSSEYRKISVDECAEILDNEGFTVARGTTPSGARYLGVLKGKSGFQVNFYGCQGDKDCLGVVFIVGFDRIKGASIERINYWNTKTKLLKAYVDGSSAVLEMAVPIEGGVTKSYLKNYVANYWSGMDQFIKYLNGAPL
jgi:hypothetical protein